MCDSSNAFDSFAPLILCLPMDGYWPVQEAELRSFVNFAITCIRPAIRSTSLSALFPTSFDTPMPPRCFGPAWAFPLS